MEKHLFNRPKASLILKTVMLFSTLFFVRITHAQATISPEIEQRKSILEAYMMTKNSIESHNNVAFIEQANALQLALKKMRLKGIPGQHINRMMELRDSLRKNSTELITLRDPEKIKNAFSEMSTQLWSVMEIMQFSENPVFLQYCPMEKAYWVHTEKAIRNPYSPTEMPKCGKIVGNFSEEDYKTEACCH